MTPDNFNTLFNSVMDEIRRLAILKGGEYAPGADRLSNFKKNAESLGLRPEAVWAVYAGKHWDAIQTFVRDRMTGVVRERAEPIEGRFHDLIVYCILGLALVVEPDYEPDHEQNEGVAEDA